MNDTGTPRPSRALPHRSYAHPRRQHRAHRVREEGALVITMAGAVGGGRHTHIPAGTNREHLRQDEGALVWVGIAFSSAHDRFAVLPEDKWNGQRLGRISISEVAIFAN